MRNKTIFCRAAVLLLTACLACPSARVTAEVKDEAIYTAEGYEDYAAERAAYKKQPVATNEVPGWPQGPAVGAAGAIVMDADSGVILYGKNINKQLYPASITKLMTGLLAYENLRPSDKVTFSENAVFGIERGSSNIGMDVGEEITVDEALYGLMVASANEVAIALGERVSGSESDFVSLMNKRAEELGCKNTHFVTTNGLHDKKHYSSVYDMALIAREMYKYPALINYMSMLNYHFEASEKQPDDFWLINTNDFLTDEVHCEDVVAGKTGYTDEARETLVTFAERDGKRLICVIMREEPPHQYTDTVKLLNYAFDNFKSINIAKEENRFTLQSERFLLPAAEIFGNSRSMCSIPEDSMLMIPNDASFADLTAQILSFSYGSGSARDETAEGGSLQEREETPEETSGTDATDEAAAPGAAVTAKAEAVPSSKTGDDPPAEPEKDSVETGNVPSADPGADTAGAAATPAASDPDQALPSFDDLDRIEPVQEDGTRILGVIRYSFNDYFLGTANVLFKAAGKESSPAGSDTDLSAEDPSLGSTAAVSGTALPKGSDRAAKGTAVPEEVHGMRALFFNLVHIGAHGSVYLNILLLLPILLGISFLLCVIFFIHGYFSELEKRRRRKRRRAGRAQRESNDRQYREPYDSGDVPRMSGGQGSSAGRTGKRS